MKRFLSIAALLVIIFTNSSFAADSTHGKNNEIQQASATIQNAFKSDFRNGDIINTEISKTFTKLTFRMDGIVLFAFYSENGNLLALVRNILSNQLPIALQMELKSKYDGYWITDLFELSGDDQNTYYITLENADHKITLRATGTQKWEGYEKTSKE